MIEPAPAWLPAPIEEPEGWVLAVGSDVGPGPVAALAPSWPTRAGRVARTGGRASLSGLERLAGAAVDLLWPPVCAHCGAGVGSAHALCPDCWRAMPFIERPYCERLGTPFAVDLGPGLLSPEAIAVPPAFDRARAVARYEGPARTLVQRLKYSDRLDLAPAMSVMMARAGAELLREADLVLPVPLHRVRLWSRRFNQAALLARAIGRAAGVPVETGALLRVKRTASQVGLTRPERAANVQGAFRVPPASKPLVQGRRLVLVDDVLTTGATLEAAARALTRTGAAGVDVLTFARVVVAPA